MNENISGIDYQEVIEYALDPLIIHSNHKIIYVNHAAEHFFRGKREDIIGASPLDIFQETSKAAIRKRIQSAYERPAELIEETIFRLDGTTVNVELYCHPLLLGDKKVIQTYVRDITVKKESETRQKEIIKQINELSTTLVPLLEGIAVLPLVGSIDEERANQLLMAVPVKVQTQNVNCLIIDFSGIYTLNSIVTEHLFKINSVMSLLGMQCILTGLRPELSRSAVQLGINLDSTRTMATVKNALHFLGITSSK
ncbi:histidine kinase [Priestia megaterium]|uniref:PAS domain S-box protein n=1 Tax=Priestia megaterium TaxID=1404 RepID=UPI000BEC9EE1|nr:PAS domain S-box protein [Priestia megaterium]PEA35993.1 histidine kinase [Priestia megaterium]